LPRLAHRLLGAYYQRLLPTLEGIVERFECQFYVWMPSAFGRTPQMTTSPHTRWAWDFLPGVATHFVYYDAKDSNTIEPTSTMLGFNIVSDSSVLYSENNGRFKTEPDSLKLPSAETESRSFVRVYVFAANGDYKKNWLGSVWNDKAHPKQYRAEEKEQFTEVSLGLWGDFCVPLTDLMDDEKVEQLVARIEQLKGEVRARVTLKATD